MTTNTPPPALRLARIWRIHWRHLEPTCVRYQEAVPLARVLGEHHAAVAAEPLEIGHG
jgi:hypothetical protein